MAGELITGGRQIEFRGLLLGDGTPYGLTNLQGWLGDLPAQRGGNTNSASGHGSYPGPLYSGDRVIVAELVVHNQDPAALDALLDALETATSPAEQPAEEPLVIRARGIVAMAQARITNRAIPHDLDYANIRLTRPALQWTASDPRIYSLTETQIPISLAAQAPGGLDFGTGGLDFGGGGLDFGESAVGGQAIVTNPGRVDSWPVLELPGPVTGPIITWAATGRRLVFDPTWTVLAGQTLIINTAPLSRSITIAGVSVSQRLITRQWSPLVKGDNPIQFAAAAYNAASSLVVRVRAAYH